MPLYPDVNGVRTSYCSIELAVNGIRLKGVRSINYRETHEVPKIRGTSSHPIGRTRGIVDFEGDIELYQADWLALLPTLTLVGTVGFAEIAHTVSVMYAELLSPQDTVLDTLVGVRFLAPESSGSEGADAQMIKLTLSIMDILWARGVYRGLRARP
jgi:hypothetical protein